MILPGIIAGNFGGYSRQALLHGHTFRQISRTIHVAAAVERDVIGKQLQGDGCHQWLQEFFDFRDVNHFVGEFGDLLISLTGNRDDWSTACK